MRIDYLLDTCAFLDLLTTRWTHRQAIEAFKSCRTAALLSVSAWEIARKMQLGKLTMPCETAALSTFIKEACLHYHIQQVDLSFEWAVNAELLPLHHRDPFDRMILACAQSTHATLITSDRSLVQYPLQILNHRLKQ